MTYQSVNSVTNTSEFISYCKRKARRFGRHRARPTKPIEDYRKTCVILVVLSSGERFTVALTPSANFFLKEIQLRLNFRNQSETVEYVIRKVAIEMGIKPPSQAESIALSEAVQKKLETLFTAEKASERKKRVHDARAQWVEAQKQD
jgi:hypothetical protein